MGNDLMPDPRPPRMLAPLLESVCNVPNLFPPVFLCSRADSALVVLKEHGSPQGPSVSHKTCASDRTRSDHLQTSQKRGLHRGHVLPFEMHGCWTLETMDLGFVLSSILRVKSDRACSALHCVLAETFLPSSGSPVHVSQTMWQGSRAAPLHTFR